MRRIIYISIIAVTTALALGIAPAAYAATIQPIDPSECNDKMIQYQKTLKLALQNPEQYLQKDKNRILICVDPAKADVGLTDATELANITNYPMIIYGLTINSSAKDKETDSYKIPNGQAALTVIGGRVLLQNFKAENLRGPIVLKGNSVGLHDATISCYLEKNMKQYDFYPKVALNVNASDSTFSKVAISNCNEAAEINGSDNTLRGFSVVFDKAKSPFDMNGGKGIIFSNGKMTAYLAPGGGEVVKNTITGYDDALVLMNHATASDLSSNGAITMSYKNPFPDQAANAADYPMLVASGISGTVYATGPAVIKANTLSGNPSVMIMKGVSPVTVSQNHFKTAATIVYADADEFKSRELFNVAWMGKAVAKDNADVVERVVGKLLDQSNTSQEVEVIGLLESDKSYNKNIDVLFKKYLANCAIATAIDTMPLKGTAADGTPIHNVIIKGDRYFDCLFVKDSQTLLQVSASDRLRFHSNTPTVSAMSDDIQLRDMPNLDSGVMVFAGQPVIVPVGSELSGGNPASIPIMDDPSVGEASGGGGSAMTAGAMLAGDGAPSMASGGGFSAGGCSLDSASSSSSGAALLWALLLLPIPILLPLRKRKDR